jgi:hypothetical protein
MKNNNTTNNLGVLIRENTLFASIFICFNFLAFSRFGHTERLAALMEAESRYAAESKKRYIFLNSPLQPSPGLQRPPYRMIYRQISRQRSTDYRR